MPTNVQKQAFKKKEFLAIAGLNDIKIPLIRKTNFLNLKVQKIT